MKMRRYSVLVGNRQLPYWLCYIGGKSIQSRLTSIANETKVDVQLQKLRRAYKQIKSLLPEERHQVEILIE